MHPFWKNTIRRHVTETNAHRRNRFRDEANDLDNEPGIFTWFMAGLVAGLMLGHWLFA